MPNRDKGEKVNVQAFLQTTHRHSPFVHRDSGVPSNMGAACPCNRDRQSWPCVLHTEKGWASQEAFRR